MRVITTRHLKQFSETHADAKASIQSWVADAEAATWQTPHDVKTRYPNASILGNNRVVFNIKGNDYRLIVAVSYVAQIILVKFVGTHADYDKVDAETVDDFA